MLLGNYFNEEAFPTSWCAGCGIGTIINAIVRAIDDSGIPPQKFVFITGIGCYGGAGSYLRFSDIHALHGRSPAYATGLKLSRPDTYPILLLGDGDASAIGGNHLIHAARRNVNLTTVVINNHIYGMTGGQGSPTTPQGTQTATSPYGQTERTFDLCRLTAAAGATFVARTTTYHVNQMAKFIGRAIQHRGFAFVEVESICPTYFKGWGKRMSPVDMLKWQKSHTVSIEKAKGLDADQRKDKIVTGIFKEEIEDEYVSDYYRKMETIQNASAPGSGVVEKPQPSALGNSAGGPARVDLRFSGSGGQGVVLSSIILAEAAGIVEGKEVVQTQSYGVESRGGASRAEVKISREEIVSSEIDRADVLIAFNQPSLDKFKDAVVDDGIIIFNSSVAEKPKFRGNIKTYGIPMTEMARSAGTEIVTNIVAIGSLVALTQVVSEDAAREAILSRIPPGTEKVNLKAFELGLQFSADMPEV